MKTIIHTACTNTIVILAAVLATIAFAGPTIVRVLGAVLGAVSTFGDGWF